MAGGRWELESMLQISFFAGMIVEEAGGALAARSSRWQRENLLEHLFEPKLEVDGCRCYNPCAAVAFCWQWRRHAAG